MPAACYLTILVIRDTVAGHPSSGSARKRRGSGRTDPRLVLYVMPQKLCNASPDGSIFGVSGSGLGAGEIPSSRDQVSGGQQK